MIIILAVVVVLNISMAVFRFTVGNTLAAWANVAIALLIVVNILSSIKKQAS